MRPQNPYVIGWSGLGTSVSFKRRAFPGLSERQYNIAQGFDAAACLAGPNGILAAAAEERFTREKATGAFPLNALRYCLAAGRLDPRDIGAVAHGFSYEPWKDLFAVDDAGRRWYDEVGSPEVQQQFLQEHFGDAGWHEKLTPVPHHLAHAASAFYPSGFDDALILISDGMGEAQSMTVALGDGADIRILKEVSAFHSLGMLYGVMTMYLGFYMNSDEYKVMGLAPYGNQRRFFRPMMEFVRLKNDGTYTIPIFSHNHTPEERETHSGIIRFLRELFGPEREPESEITQVHKDIAAALQAVLEACQLHVLQHFREQTGRRNLCLAGGVALNCAANGAIRRSRLFERMFVQPAAGDDGTALGAALYVQRRQHPTLRLAPITVPLWGPEFGDDEIRQALSQREDCEIAKCAERSLQTGTADEASAPGEATSDALCQEVAGRLAQGQIVAWFQGRMEFGPRALGSRSILADPRDPSMRDKINALVKKREAFRPFAPVVTSEAAARIFEITPGKEHEYAHMLYVTRVRPEYRDQLPATTHVDGSARVQTVSQEQNPKLWQLLKQFEKLTGLPVLLNTSFNVRGQPIVCTPKEAIETFRAANLDALAAGDLLILPRKSTVGGQGPEVQTESSPAGCIHEFFEAQARKTPDAVAVVFEDQQLSYDELDRRANQVAHYLRKLGVGPETLVGICMDVSTDLMVAMLGTLKAGGAYVPLDPDFPRERLEYMAHDAQLKVIVTEQRFAELFTEPKAATRPAETSVSHGPLVNGKVKPPTIICLDTQRNEVRKESAQKPAGGATPENLAYVIYTSGSTGRPKGVMVAHRNAANFFVGMDARIGSGPPGVWMAVTSICFDISVLELFWTLSRGFKVVLARKELMISRGRKPHSAGVGKLPDLSLFYFASDESAEGADKYRLLLKGARFADEHGFAAVWTPERHFHAFGGLYPNPSVTSAAVAAITRRVQIRAGSVVLPLHNVIRVAEEWAVVDNLSHGRVGISVASGWQVNDFVLSPENYSRRKEIMVEQIELLRKLWRGETVPFPGSEGHSVPVRILPRPVQPELPLWITASGSPDTFRLAGELGANLLTHLLGQSLEEVAGKIALYREAWKAQGHPGQGRVALMLHTFVGQSLEEARAVVRNPLLNYLRSSIDLIKNRPAAFSAFKQARDSGSARTDNAPAHFTKEDLDVMSGHAFERYFESSGLFGTTARCLERLGQARAIGVDEVACLIDFGIEAGTVLAGLERLAEVRPGSGGARLNEPADYSLAAQMARHGVTHMQCTPSLAALLAEDSASLAALRSLKKLLLGGEALPPGLLRKLDVPGEVFNMYGPTETTIWSTACLLDKSRQTVSIGKPIANTQVYIVDEALRPVRAGEAGELWIGGAGVVRGYLNRPELTAEKFIADPFSQGRVYRTGDLARYLPDGNIEFLGRLDQQVKLRGYRVELGEIEAILERHPQVSQCAVSVREDIPGDQRLVAYVVPVAGVSPEAGELRRWTQQSLPEYMTPSIFVQVSALPLTPNGKLDRKSLPKPGAASNLAPSLQPSTLRSCQPVPNGSYKPATEDGSPPGEGASLAALRGVINQGTSPTPQNVPSLPLGEGRAEGSSVPLNNFPPQAGEPIARYGARAADNNIADRVAEVWRGVLGVAQAAPKDNFFELGGNSVSATQLIFRLRAILGWEVPLRFAFEFPTLQEFAAALAAHRPKGAAVSIEEQIARRKEPSELPLSFAQQRLWFLDQLEPGPQYNDHFALRLSGPLNVEALENALNEIIRRHETLRATFGKQDGQPAQSIRPSLILSLPAVDVSGESAACSAGVKPEEAAAGLAVEQGRRLFRLDEGPLVRASLLRLGPEDHVLALTFHHIVIDGWSRGVLLRELTTLYAAFVKGQASPLPELSIQYADYAAWQQEQWREDRTRASHLAYWKEQLRGAPEVLELPADRPRPAAQTYRGARLPIRLDKPLFDKLAGLGREEGCTPFMVLLAAFQTLLARYSGQTDILVGSPVANRSRPEIEPLIGYFLNLLVLRGDLSGDPSFRRLLGRVRETALAAYAHQDLPFEKLVAELQPARALAHSPLFQCMFILQNTPKADADPEGLSFRPFEIDPGVSKVDLTLNLEETAVGCAGWLEYATDLFDAATAERIAADLQALLEGVSSRPDERLSRLALRTTPEPLLPLLPLESGSLNGNGSRGGAATAAVGQEAMNRALPQTPVEKRLAQIWSEVLGTSDIGLHDSLFDLGGHSLLITMILSRIRKAFELEMPIQTLFESPTVAATAEWIELRVKAGRGNVATTDGG